MIPFGELDWWFILRLVAVVCLTLAILYAVSYLASAVGYFLFSLIDQSLNIRP